MGSHLSFTGNIRYLAEVLRRKYKLPRESRFTISALIKAEGHKKAIETLAKEYAEDANTEEYDIKSPKSENGSPKPENGNGNMLK